MNRRRNSAVPIISAINTGALGAAMGIILATGVTAAIAFPAMRELAPTLPGYAAVEDHWLIAAGSIMAQVFRVTAIMLAIAFAGAVVTLFVLIARAGAGRNRAAVLLRSLVLLAAVAVFTHYAAVLMPRMNRTFDDFLNAARTGDSEQAVSLRASFDSDHPASRRDLSTLFALTTVAWLLTGWPLHSTRGRA